MSKGEEIKGFRQEETSRAPSKPPEDTGSGGQASPRPGSYSPPLTDGKAEAQGVEGAATVLGGRGPRRSPCGGRNAGSVPAASHPPSWAFSGGADTASLSAARLV